MEILERAGDALEARELYGLLRLRVDVFVVEQSCPYPELDGRDLDAGTSHWWIEDPAGVVSALRMLSEPGGGSRLGRVVTRRDARGLGHATELVDRALRTAPRPVVCDAQAHLTAWYAAFGFTPTGPEFVEDGIPHVPMRLSSPGPE